MRRERRMLRSRTRAWIFPLGNWKSFFVTGVHRDVRRLRVFSAIMGIRSIPRVRKCGTLGLRFIQSSESPISADNGVLCIMRETSVMSVTLFRVIAKFGIPVAMIFHYEQRAAERSRFPSSSPRDFSLSLLAVVHPPLGFAAS